MAMMRSTQPGQAPAAMGGAQRKKPAQAQPVAPPMPPPPAQTAPFQPLPQPGGQQLTATLKQPYQPQGGAMGAPIGPPPPGGASMGVGLGSAAQGGVGPGLGQAVSGAMSGGQGAGGIPPQLLQILQQLKGQY
jgi:hypothetical protein